MVAGEKASRSQRRRWEGGRLGIMKLYGAPLLREAWAQKSGLLFDLAMDVLVPPLSWLVAPTGLLFVVSVVLSDLSPVPIRAVGLFGLSLVMLGLYVLRGWMLSGVGVRGLFDLAYAPVYVFWTVVLLFGRKDKKGEWVRTTREAETKRVEDER